MVGNSLTLTPDLPTTPAPTPHKFDSEDALRFAKKDSVSWPVLIDSLVPIVKAEDLLSHEGERRQFPRCQRLGVWEIW
jgi:hypothetical protein